MQIYLIFWVVYATAPRLFALHTISTIPNLDLSMMPLNFVAMVITPSVDFSLFLFEHSLYML